MASSGSFNTSAYAFSSGDRYLTFNWKVVSQSIVNNETVISWELVGGGTYQYNPKCGGFKVTIDGEVVYEQPTSYRVNVYIGTLIASGTKTIAHNADGNRSFSASAEAGIYTVAVNCSGSGTWELPKIPRASSLDVSDGVLGTAQVLTVIRDDTDCTHTITYECGTASGTICTKSASGSINFTPPLSLASQNTTGVTVAVRFVLQTYYGDTAIGSAVTKTVTMAIPASVKPSLTLAVSDNNGHATTYGAYIKSLSQLKIVTTPSLAYGSEIASYNIQANGNTYNESSVVTDMLKSYGTLAVKATVTDKRGRTSDTVTVNITVWDYTAPAISKITASRCNSDGTANEQGAYLKVTFSASITSLSSKNTAAYTLKYKKSSATSYTSVTLPALAGSYAVTDYSYIFAAESTPYVAVVTATDKHNSSSRSVDCPASFYLIAPNASGKGLGLGMASAHEEGLDIGFDTYMNEKKLTGLAYPKNSSDAASKKYVDAQIAAMGGTVGAITLTDQTTGTLYLVYVESGNLKMETVDGTENSIGSFGEIVLIDRTTELEYRLYVNSGDLMMESVG